MNGTVGLRPWLLGLAGASGSGKSTVARALAEELGEDRCVVLSLDAYYRDRSDVPEARREALNYDEPEAWEVERMVRDLGALRRGCAIEVPEYDFERHCRKVEARLLRPRPVILVEGIFLLCLPEVVGLLDATVGLELSAEECLARRLARDVGERGREEVSIREQFARDVVPSMERWITPSMTRAGLRLSGNRPLEELVTEVRGLLPEEEGDDQFSGLPGEFAGLARRLGPEVLSQRLHKQSSLWAGKQHQGEGLLVVERYVPIDLLITRVLKWTGFYGWGYRQACRVRVATHRIYGLSVPTGLEGFRLLQLSDLHADIDPGVVEGTLRALARAEYDLAVVTGDYRNSTSEDFSAAMAAMARILPAVKTRVYGVLGNHDFVEMATALEAMGLPMLLNEVVVHQHGGAELVVAGIDDPHFYQTGDLAGVVGMLDGGREGGYRVLLSHSPETYGEAAEHFDLLLAGHTHGGQICLPGGIAVVRIGRCPGRMLKGSWREGQMVGYTSPGTGCCGVPVRYFCPPEITIHELHHGPEFRTTMQYTLS